MSQPDNGSPFPKIKKQSCKIYDNDAIYAARGMTMNPIRLEFHNGTVLVYQTFYAFSSMALMMVSKISNFVNAADGQSDT
jgi:hypothetical protein